MVHKSLRSLQLDVIPYPTVSHRCKNIFIGQIIIMTFFFFLKTGLIVQPLVTQNLLCRSGWAQTRRNPPAFAFWVLELKVCTTMPGFNCHHLNSPLLRLHFCNLLQLEILLFLENGIRAISLFLFPYSTKEMCSYFKSSLLDCVASCVRCPRSRA